MNYYRCEKHARAVSAETPRGAAEVFAQRMSNRLFGLRAGKPTLTWISDSAGGRSSTFEADTNGRKFQLTVTLK